MSVFVFAKEGSKTAKLAIMGSIFPVQRTAWVASLLIY